MLRKRSGDGIRGDGQSQLLFLVSARAAQYGRVNYDMIALTSTAAYTTHGTSIALNMAGVKRFDMIGLDT